MANLLDLPTELIHIIVEQVRVQCGILHLLRLPISFKLHVSNHYRTLKSLRLTCKLLCQCIDPVLFSTVNINLHHLTRATSLLEAFATERSTVNRFAKHLEIMSLEQRYEGHDVNVCSSVAYFDSCAHSKIGYTCGMVEFQGIKVHLLGYSNTRKR